MIEIKHRFTEALIYKSDTAETVAQAVAEMIQKAREEGRVADLRCSNLSNSNLRCSDLSCSDLSGSNLSNSNLSNSDLSNSNLSNSDLSNSNLSGSHLSNSNLSGSKLRGSNRVSLGFDDRGYHFFLSWENDQRIIRAGCRVYTMEEAREHWANKPEILARLDLADTIAESRNWKDVV